MRAPAIGGRSGLCPGRCAYIAIFLLLSLRIIEHLSRIDDIRPRVAQYASGMEMWTKVEPSMFEDILNAEMNKYEVYKNEVLELNSTIDELLERIKVPKPYHCLSDVNTNLLD